MKINKTGERFQAEMCVKSNIPFSRQKGALCEGLWDTPPKPNPGVGVQCLCFCGQQAAAISSWYSQIFGVIGRGLSLAPELRSAYFGIVRRTGQIRDPPPLAFCLRCFTLCLLGYCVAPSASQCHSAKPTSGLLCFS